MILNSLFDTNGTGTGHQPYGFDQLAALYGKYRVDSVDVTLLWSTIGSSADLCCAVQVAPAVGYTAVTGMTADFATEHPMISTGVLSASGNTRSVSMRLHVHIPTLFGLTDAQYRNNEDQYAAVVSANPSLVAHCSFAVGSYSGSAGEQASCQCIMEFSGEFYVRNNLTQS